MSSDDVIQSVLNSPDFLHLHKEIVELPGRAEPFVPPRKILVIENCGLADARRGRIDREIKSNPINNEFIDPLDEFGAARLYVDLAAHSFGDVPNLIQFLAMLPEDMRVWTEKSMQINPAQFEWIKEMTKVIEQVDREFLKSIQQEVVDNGSAETKKKKARKRRRLESG